MSISLFDRLRHWLHAEPATSGSFDPLQFERLCLEDPHAALEALAQDQRELAEQFEATLVAYQDRVADLAGHLKTLGPEDVQQEARVLRDAQDGIRRILRRLEASVLTSRDLERELKEWEQRRGEHGPRHADHPEVRAEILRSELSARGHGKPLDPIAPDASPFSRHAMDGLGPDEGMGDDAEFACEDTLAPDAEHLLVSIRHATREAERWHDSMETHRDAVDDVHTLKKLHATLKRLDRERGLQRDRLTLAVRMHGDR